MSDLKPMHIRITIPKPVPEPIDGYCCPAFERSVDDGTFSISPSGMYAIINPTNDRLKPIRFCPFYGHEIIYETVKEREIEKED